jgi:hypothetical protein
MATIKALYGTEAQAITCTLASLASGNARESTVVDNTSDLFLDVLACVRITLANGGTLASDKKVYVYAYGTVDAATPIYPDKVTGSDAAITLDDPTQLKLIGVIECASYVTATVITFTMEPTSVAQVFGGLLPEKWGIVVQNKTGIAFTSGETDKAKIYQGLKAQSV